MEQIGRRLARIAKTELSAERVESKYSQSEYAARAAGLVYKMEQAIPIYGGDRE